MINKFARLTLAMTLALGLALPAVAETESDENKDSSSFISRLADAARNITKSDDDTTGSDEDTTLSQIIKSSDSKTRTDTARDKKAVVLTIMGNIEERAPEMVLFGTQPESLKVYIDTLRRARLDDDVNTVVLRLGPNDLGMATAQELREAITNLQKANKKVISVLEDDSQASYLVASAANEVVIPPSGDLMLHGVSADSYFLKNLLAKVGVKVQIIHIGDYKSYGETFTQEDFTTPARENMTEIVDGVYDQVINMLADSRDMTPQQATAALDAGPIGAKQAQELGLVDRVAYLDQVLKDLEDDSVEIVESSDYKSTTKSTSDEVSLLSILSLLSKSDNSDDSGSKDYPRVALLYAVGPITLGASDSGFSSSNEITSQDFIDELEKIMDDEKIKAVILRVNSPGGSAFASDLIWKKIEELKKKKPVVASMGDVAASGGYYISMGASHIVAQPGTLTGSIGVVGGKPNLAGLYDKLGVNKTTISKGTYAGLFSETKDFTPQEHQAIESMMKRTYDEFVNKAARGRKTTYEQIHEVAQGRIWTGEQAREAGLVDSLGGLDEAIVETKKLIGLTPDDKVRLIAYPKERNLVDILQKAFGTSSSTVRVGAPASDGLGALIGSLPIPQGLQAVLEQATTISRMFNQENVLAVMPALIQIR